MAVAALGFSLVSLLFVHPYQYGIGDTSITIPFVRVAANPALYPGDLMVAQRPFYYTLLWNALGWLHAHVGLPIESLYFGGYAVALFFTFLGIGALARTLFPGRRAVVLLAMVFLLAGKHTLGSVYTIERVLSTRLAALPFLLFALDAFLRGRRVRTGVLLGLGYLVHPITTHYALAMIVVAALVGAAPAGRRGTLVSLLAFAIVAIPIIAWRLAVRPPGSLLHVDPGWLEAVRVRSANHMLPSTWDGANWVQAAIVIGLFALAWARRNAGGAAGDPLRHRAMGAFAATIVALGIAGIVFSEVVPLGIVLLVQPLRSFQFLEILAALYVANALSGELEHASFVRALGAALVGGLMFVAVHYEPLPTILYAACVIGLLLRPGTARLARFAVGSVVLATFVWIGMAAGIRASFDRFAYHDVQEPAWLELQRWARDATPRDAMFVVPPAFGGEFRVESERTVYADAEDGGLMNGNPQYGIEWLRRMRRLGFRDDFGDALRNYRQMNADTVTSLAREAGAGHSAVFFVTTVVAAPLPFAVAHRNARYIAYRVSPPS